MRFDREFNEDIPFNYAGTKSFDIERGYLNGIAIQGLIYSATIGDGYRDVDVTVKVVDGKRNKYLLNRVPLKYLAEMSNYRFGSVGSVGNDTKVFEQLETFFEMFVEDLDNEADVVDNAFLNSKNYAMAVASQISQYKYDNEHSLGTVFIPLGGLTLDDKHIDVKLDFPTTNVGNTGGGSNQEFVVCRYSTGKVVEHQLEYDLTNDLEQRLKMVSECWVKSKDSKRLSVAQRKLDCTLELEAEPVQQFTISDALNMVNGFGRIESNQINHTAMLFGKDDNIPAEGWIEIRDPNNSIELLVVREIYDSEEVVKATETQIRKTQQKVAAIESDSSRDAVELQKVGVLPEYGEVAEMAEAVKEVKNSEDGLKD